MSQYDYDWVVVGSGFGGSVSALRLAEKGYEVAVLECGKRFTDKDFPKSTWDVRRYFWARELAPHYDEAKRMLGVVNVDSDDAADDLLREYGEHLGVGDTYQKTPVGIFFGEAGKTVPDPFFGGEGT